jgi:two-component system alkaline phosphatase synthesis response regulator PhoP
MSVMVYKILVVEDTPENLEMYEIMLEQKGFSILKAEDGKTALKLIKSEKPDLIILDKMLPDISGSEICQVIKKDTELSHIPVIIITAKSDTPDEMAKDFEVGADDYIRKPFEREKLYSHIDKFLKNIDYKKEGIDKILRSGDLLLNIEVREVKVKDSKIFLTRKEFDLLYLLIRKVGQVIKKEDIADIVWGYNFVEIYNTIDGHIVNLRRKLGKEIAKRIVKIDSVGYKCS